ncbi:MULTISPECIES: acetyl-CoA C-acyltransferase [unclassified Marinobacter]|jgi:acetyl-CoA C-acetyltransferase|uniref:acetyl-CoA C-acyltransferase n=1 Tax=unclassified Marinobacter TaxID=83889 RepID=UPI00200F33C8|nr:MULTISPECIES: acetyl-CoA C-acyltransferase [unclassified Marinobacter]UQG55365.1 acetyl-CoA C-acyltransferase [Marinobacter sp. M4C]UQG64169.1 acetyl-CoA C-acyltransferase [Marinobacter sp. M2C]UQG68448.1 acetyl-CoA C-acyltransferase [Marinobacter sp. M1C]
MKAAYIVDFARSAFTRAHPRKPEVDAWSGQRGDALLGQVIDALLNRTKVPGNTIEDLSVGCALPVKDQWSFGGRYPQWLSGLGIQCPSRQIDQQCGSGLAALRSTAREIQAGAIETGMAGGYENMSRVPMGPALFEEGVLIIPESLKQAGSVDLTVAMNMGLTAENLAREAHLSREAMDAFAVRSHQRAARAEQEGWFAGERLALRNPAGESVERDANIRPGTSAERLADLKPAFSDDGQVTAGNSSPLTSGASAALLMSEIALNLHGLSPLARVVAVADCGVSPECMGAGATVAAERVLKAAGLSASDIDAWEINEAFSAVPLYAIRSLDIDRERVNIFGGALALGHPLGATGIRLAGTLARILRHQGGRFGCATTCVGGGQGIALVLERC